MTELVTFPGLDRPVAPLGVGCWAWGDKGTWGMGGYDTTISETTIAEALDASLAGGVTFFDTAEVYGGGESERILGRLLAASPERREQVVIATKFYPLPHKVKVVQAARVALERSLERLGVDQVDLYQLHGPINPRGAAARAEALAQLVRAGLTKAVGVSNYSAAEMGAIHAELAKRGVPLASNQIECSLLRMRPVTSGLVDACRALGVVPLAYSPIGQGRLTGKYSAQNPPPGRRTFSNHPMDQVDRLVAVLRRIGEVHDRTPAQVSLRWLIQKGLVPIPGAKNAGQAAQNAGALGWTLSDGEIAELNDAGFVGREMLVSRIFWQHG